MGHPIKKCAAKPAIIFFQDFLSFFAMCINIPKRERNQTIKNEKSIKIVLTQKWCNYNVNMYCLRQRAYLYKLLSSNITRRNGNVL